MTYEEALDFWFRRVNYERYAPQPGDLKLDRMCELLRRIGDPQDRLRIVHVAGSKGKGSTSAMVAAIVQQAGYRCGLFTSPHLCGVEERVQINRIPIGAEDIVAGMEVIRKAVEGLAEPLSPTFFEIATALAFLHFARQKVELAVMEVGLGGRFDSTNVCRPLVAMITSISFDHTDILGDRLASIAMEKAGIVKPGCVTISGATPLEAREVIEAIARERGAPLLQLNEDFRYQYEPGRVLTVPAAEDGFRLRKPKIVVTTRQRTWPVMELGLLGDHQAANAALAVACVEQLRARGLAIGDEAVSSGLSGVEWPARLEVLRGQPLVVLDCAHNLASVQAMVDTVTTSFAASRRWLIFGGSSDKDLAGMLGLLGPHFGHVYLTRYRSSSRSVSPEDLARLLPADAKWDWTLCATPDDAWYAAQAAAGPNDLICVTGSVFLAGEIRPLLITDEVNSTKTDKVCR
jgi:dihydrofolate synthase/folylpolyglutamate synthase